MTDVTDSVSDESTGEAPDDVAAGMYASMDELFDFADPQPGYIKRIEEGGFLRPMPGMAMSYSRLNTDYVLRHHEEFSSAEMQMELGNVRPLIPLNVDPPLQSKYRKLLDPLFAPRVMDQQEEDITRRVNGFIDAFIDRGECNFTEEFAEVFPSSVFLGLMGLPEDEMRMFLHMRDGILHSEKWDENALFDQEARRRVLDRAGAEIYDYFGRLIAERREHPAADIITRFTEAEIDGDKLTDEDILDICFLFLIAGLDTVSDTLTCSYAFLARNPAHRKMIVDDPSVIPMAVEELLRWESPVPQGVPRTSTCPVDLPSGEHVDAGTAVMPMYGAANVDPAVFENPLEVRFDRENNPHIAFGGGVHRCLGSHLARRELRVTLREWHRRIPEYRIKPGHEQLEYPPGLRHVKDLMLTWK
ncbi:MAG TPA: cytochrome P450 [Acidimicrobiia bacterium]|jgi:cytochrome P450